MIENEPRLSSVTRPHSSISHIKRSSSPVAEPEDAYKERDIYKRFMRQISDAYR